MKHKEKPQILKCPYCGRTAVLRKASDIYEKALDEYLYVCSGYPECNSMSVFTPALFVPRELWLMGICATNESKPIGYSIRSGSIKS